MRELLVGLGAATAVPLIAAPTASAASVDDVTVSNESGVVRVSTQLPGQPLVGASADSNTGEVCVGFSLQVPQCVGGVATGQ
jgi:hypothetical protein